MNHPIRKIKTMHGRRKHVAITGLLVGAVLFMAAGGAAAAWIFNTGTSNVTTAANMYTINNFALTGGPLQPGVTETVTATVTNVSGGTLVTGVQHLTAAGTTFTTDSGGGVYDTLTSAFVDTCPAADFSFGPWVAITGGTGGDWTGGNVALLNGQTELAQAVVTISTSAPQTGCSGIAPKFTVVYTP